MYKSWIERIGLLILGVLLGVFLGEPIKEWRRDRIQQKKVPEQLLGDASTYRTHLTESDLNAAREKYELVIEKAAGLRVQAYQGLSRTYADWSAIRFRRGLSRGDYPDKAIGYALKAVREAPGARGYRSCLSVRL